MPHREDTTIRITELHPTFAAEVRGVDFSKDIPHDVFQEVLEAITKVCMVSVFSSLEYAYSLVSVRRGTLSADRP